MSWKNRLKEVQQRQAMRLDEAIARARELEAQDKLTEAELTIRRADSDIYGGIAIADMHRDRLRRLVKHGDREKAIEAFHLARAAAGCTTPEPHTEFEAERNRQAVGERVAELVAILGFDPGATK